MSIRHAVLAALLEGEASGYQLAKRFDVSVANFWHASPQQLYAELPRLEAAGLISGQTVRQQGRPDKRVYRLSGQGSDELAAFVSSPSRPTAVRDDLMVKVQAAEVADSAPLIAALEERAGHAERRSALYQQLLDAMLAGRSERDYLRVADRVGPYLTCVRGRTFEQENLSWYRWTAETLQARRDSVS